MYQRNGSRAPQKRAKPFIASTGKPTPAKPKAGLQMMAVRLMPSREIARQKLEQAAEREIGDDQKAGRGPHQHRVAAKRNLVDAVDDAGVDDHHHDEDRKQRRELADERGERAAAGGSEPGAQAAPRELGTDRISGRNRGHDMKDRGQDGAQQKLGVVQRRVGQNILLDDQRARRERFAAPPMCEAASRWPPRWRWRSQPRRCCQE